MSRPSIPSLPSVEPGAHGLHVTTVVGSTGFASSVIVCGRTRVAAIVDPRPENRTGIAQAIGAARVRFELFTSTAQDRARNRLAAAACRKPASACWGPDELLYPSQIRDGLCVGTLRQERLVLAEAGSVRVSGTFRDQELDKLAGVDRLLTPVPDDGLERDLLPRRPRRAPDSEPPLGVP